MTTEREPTVLDRLLDLLTEMGYEGGLEVLRIEADRDTIAIEVENKDESGKAYLVKNADGVDVLATHTESYPVHLPVSWVRETVPA